MKTIALLLTGVCTALLTGCSATRQFVPLPDQARHVEDFSKGRIYVMRPASGFWETAGMSVSDDGKFIGRTGPNGFLCWERPPGDTIITGKSEGVSQLPVTVQAGGTYYIFQHLRMGFLKARNELEVLSEEEGRKILKDCKPPRIEAAPVQPYSVTKESAR